MLRYHSFFTLHNVLRLYNSVGRKLQAVSATSVQHCNKYEHHKQDSVSEKLRTQPATAIKKCKTQNVGRVLICIAMPCERSNK